MIVALALFLNFGPFDGEKVGNWEITREIDPMTDQVRVRAFNRSDAGSIGLKCDRHGTGSVYWQFVSETVLNKGRDQAAVRFDAEKPTVALWNYDLRSAFLTSGVEVARLSSRALAARTMALRFRSYDNRYLDLKFDLGGAGDVIPAVYRECGDTLK